MPAETDDELRALQRRAYGRDGGLTDAEARRLRVLELAQREPTPAPPAPAPAEGLVEGVPLSIAAPAARASDAGSSPRAEVSVRDPSTRSGTQGGGSDTQRSPGTPDVAWRAPQAGSGTMRDLLRERWRVVAAASVLLLALGVGAGWAIFSPRPDGIVLSEAQEQRRLELYEQGEYDEGSLRPIGQDADALAWFATRNGGALDCLVLDVGEQSDGNCQEAELTDGFPLSARVMSMGDAAGGADSGEGDELGGSVEAYLLYSTSGEPVATIRRMTPDSSTVVGDFQGEERERAQELYDEGYRFGLAVLGPFRDEPVWIADRSVGASFETCLIVDAVAATHCAPADAVRTDGLSIVITDPAETGSGVFMVQVEYGNGRLPNLTIIGDGEMTRFWSEDGERIELGGEHGDPIEVTIPSEPEG